MKYYLDTNTVIYYFKGMGNVFQNFHKIKPKQLYLPSIVLYELQVGILKSNNPRKRNQQLSTLLSQIQVVPFSNLEALFSAKVRAELEMQGTIIGDYDIQIAGTALANKATLVTHNIKEFSRVSDLNIVDWF